MLMYHSTLQLHSAVLSQVSPAQECNSSPSFHCLSYLPFFHSNTHTIMHACTQTQRLGNQSAPSVCRSFLWMGFLREKRTRRGQAQCICRHAENHHQPNFSFSFHTLKIFPNWFPVILIFSRFSSLSIFSVLQQIICVFFDTAVIFWSTLH